MCPFCDRKKPPRMGRLSFCLKYQIQHHICQNCAHHAHQQRRFFPRQRHHHQCAHDADFRPRGVNGEDAGENEGRHSGVGDELQKLLGSGREVHLVDEESRQRAGGVSHRTHGEDQKSSAETLAAFCSGVDEWMK